MIKELVLKQHIVYEDSRFRKLPHIIYESNEKCIQIITSILDCTAGMWPLTPRYNDNGILDPIEFYEENNGISDSQLWKLWSNPYNQKFLAESCGRYSGIFDTSDTIIVNISIDYDVLNKAWEKKDNYDETLWTIIFSVLDLTKWAVLHFYENDTFIFLAESTMYNFTSRIKRKFFEEGINFICIHPNGEIKHGCHAVDDKKCS
jgi:hypothetical protein